MRKYRKGRHFSFARVKESDSLEDKRESGDCHEEKEKKRFRGPGIWEGTFTKRGNLPGRYREVRNKKDGKPRLRPLRKGGDDLLATGRRQPGERGGEGGETGERELVFISQKKLTQVSKKNSEGCWEDSSWPESLAPGRGKKYFSLRGRRWERRKGVRCK